MIILLPTNCNSSASSGSSGSLHHSIYDKDHFNGKNITVVTVTTAITKVTSVGSYATIVYYKSSALSGDYRN